MIPPIKKSVLLWLSLFLVIFGYAQPVDQSSDPLVGIWKGTFYVDSTKMTWPFELSVSEINGVYSGYTRLEFEENGRTEIVIRNHTVSRNGNEYTIVDEGQVAKGSTVSQPKEIRKTMQVSIQPAADSTWSITGTWNTPKTQIRYRVYRAMTGTVQLKKEKEYKESALFKKLDSLKLTAKLSYHNPPAIPEPVVAKATSQPVIAAPEEKYLMKKFLPDLKPVELKRPSRTAKLMAKGFTTIKLRPMAIIRTGREKPEKPVAIAKEKPDAPAVAITTPVTVPTPSLPVSAKRNNNIIESGNAAKDFGTRRIATMQEVNVKSDSIQLTLYDNGEIDGDTVSVLMNGKLVIARQRLDVKPNVHTIYFDADSPDSMNLVMYAENLGTIAPNTGLLLVKDGSTTYEVRFSADLKTNAAIILRRKRE